MHSKTKIAIGLGSNLGNREENIKKAFTLLCEEFLEDGKLSSLIETEPWGVTNQPKFINAVCTGMSEWDPPAIVNYCKILEREMGRTEEIKYGPRLIDMDLLIFGNQTWNSDGVVVPHPEMKKRDFVMRPLLEIWPDCAILSKL